MPRKDRKQSKKQKETSAAATSDKKNLSTVSKTKAGKAKAPEESTNKFGEVEISFLGPISGNPSLMQSTYGNVGNFELVVPLSSRGLAYYWRDNDDCRLSWHGPIKFAEDAGKFEGVSLIQGDFGESGNLELVATDFGGHNLVHFWRDSGSFDSWFGPLQISEKSLVPIFSKGPSMIRSGFGCRGNFDLVVPLVQGGFAHYWRNNDDPNLPWYGPENFATKSGIFEAVSLIQSNFGDIGNLELVARSGDTLQFFWCEPDEAMIWNGPETIATGVSGTPSMIQSTFGKKGNFELVVPLATGGLAYYWRDNDDPHMHWYGPLTFGMSVGMVDSVSLIQSNFGDPGHLELVAQAEGHLVFFWRDSGPDLRWNGPQYLTVRIEK